ncbi:MAG: metal ABC transporter permease [Peptococcaceae bacterium BICA1-7]|nr:MAG: metal ABC transporter permease [Peptococcaceae bacterium BICA1-7]HBV98608.1 metal ABC transporter permease [Desulfotomaculum sp.]
MEIFHYEFMRNAFITGMLVGVVCPVVGLFVTLKRLSLIADSLSHVCLSGVAAGLLLGTQPVLTASIFSLSGAFLIEAIRMRYKTYPELAIAIILSTGAAGGAIMLGLGKGLNANFMSYLFGSIVTVNGSDVLIISGAVAVILVLVKLFFKELFTITFDEEAAAVAGLPVKYISVGFTAMTALTIAVSIKIVGILLVSSLMILPVAAALKLAGSFRGALFLSVAAGELAVVSGLFASFYFNLAPGGVVIMTAVVILALSMLYGALRASSSTGQTISS